MRDSYRVGDTGPLSAPPIPFARSAERRLRRLLREASDQLCQMVDGELNFVVRASEGDDDVDKLLLLVNFALDTARRSMNGLREAHLRLEEDLAAARELQMKLLPQLVQPRNARVGAICIPAKAVGGDFFDFFHYRRRGLYAGIIADVSGKGAAAAILAALTSGIIRSWAEEELDPKRMLERLNRKLYGRAPEGRFVAMTYSTWDDRNRVLETCGSGLPEPLLYRDGEVRSLTVHGLPLGLFPGAEYDPVRIQCAPGDTLLFYTDGITEALDSDGSDYGTERLAELFRNNCHRDPEEIVAGVVEAVRAHSGGECSLDDETVMVLKVM